MPADKTFLIQGAVHKYSVVSLLYHCYTRLLFYCFSAHEYNIYKVSLKILSKADDVVLRSRVTSLKFLSADQPKRNENPKGNPG